FLGLGVLAVLGLLPGTSSPGSANLVHDGGFLPNGMDGLLVGLLASVVAYGGLETVTIAAAESDDPVRGVARAVKTTMWRIAIVYVGSMLVIVTLLPWNDPAVTGEGPYAATLDHLGIPAAGEIMNVVILIALLSAMNANIYGSSRMAHSLVSRGQGPKALGKVSGRVPRRAVLASCGFGFVTVLLSYWYPDTLFAWLLNMVGGVILVVWGFIAVSQFVLRRRLEREAPEKLVVKMWGFPYLTWVALAGVAGVLVLMLLGEDTRVQVVFTGGLTLALAATGYVVQRRAAARA
ncbi:amino acid transporter, partial [Streptomyces sp. NRRL S-444]